MKHRLMLSLALACTGLVSCVSHPAMRIALEERDNEIRDLRNERMQLRQQVQMMTFDKERLEAALAEASAKRAEPVAARDPEPRERLFPELDELGVGYGLRDGNVVISLPSAITFSSGKATLSDSGRSALAAVARRLQNEFKDGVYHIEGHTDNDPIRKSKFASNRALSVERAMAVLTYLVEDAGVPDDRCVVTGFGQYRPMAPNDSSEQKAKNRRVEIVVRSTR